MNATCLHCHRKLKGNDVIESFPVGERVAYDPAKRRFWVVCHKCGKWNMAPLDDDERAGAIEVLERWWRDSPRHYTAGGIGVGRYSDKFSVVRIGEATWPEFASWRYAESIRRRNVAQNIRWGASYVFMAGAVAVGWMPLASAVSVGILLPLSQQLWPQMYLRGRQAICRIPGARGERPLIRSKHLANMELERTRDSWQMNTVHDSGSAQLTGDEGVRALSYALSRINHVGATRKSVSQGLAFVEEHGGTEALMEKAARVARAKGGEASAPIMLYPEPMRVALELASRELRERHELENEIAILKHDWREA